MVIYAKRHGVDSGDMSRILPLAFLAPDIKEAILCGTQPVNLTLDQLCRSLPLAWFDQRRVLGFKPICLSYDSGAHSAKMGRCQRGVCRSLQGFPSTA